MFKKEKLSCRSDFTKVQPLWVCCVASHSTHGSEYCRYTEWSQHLKLVLCILVGTAHNTEAWEISKIFSISLHFILFKKKKEKKRQSWNLSWKCHLFGFSERGRKLFFITFSSYTSGQEQRNILMTFQVKMHCFLHFRKAPRWRRDAVKTMSAYTAMAEILKTMQGVGPLLGAVCFCNKTTHVSREQYATFIH